MALLHHSLEKSMLLRKKNFVLPSSKSEVIKSNHINVGKYTVDESGYVLNYLKIFLILSGMPNCARNIQGS